MARPGNAVVAGILEYSYRLMSIYGCYMSGQSGLYHLHSLRLDMTSASAWSIVLTYLAARDDELLTGFFDIRGGESAPAWSVVLAYLTARDDELLTGFFDIGGGGELSLIHISEPTRPP